MNGLRIVGSFGQVEKRPDPSIVGVVIEELQTPLKDCELETLLYPLIIGQPLTQHLISTLKQQILLYYQKIHHPVVDVLVPEQDLTAGILQLVIIESCVDQVTAVGAHHFSNERIREQVRLKQGGAINTDTLLRDVAWINQNPFRQTNITFTPGSAPWTTDIKLITFDRRPLRVYAGAKTTPETSLPGTPASLPDLTGAMSSISTIFFHFNGQLQTISNASTRTPEVIPLFCPGATLSLCSAATPESNRRCPILRATVGARRAASAIKFFSVRPMASSFKISMPATISSGRTITSSSSMSPGKDLFRPKSRKSANFYSPTI